MEQALPLTDAYQRLLDTLCRRLGAERAELLLRLDPQRPACIVARHGPDRCRDGQGAVLEMPIHEGPLEIGRLCMTFLPGAALPGPAELELTRVLVELAALLIEEHHALISEPLRQAGRRILAVTEEELQRLILDIHDGPVQKLFVVSSQLALLQARVLDCPPETQRDLRPTLNRLETLVQSALQDIKATLSTFRPAEFQRRGLPSVLQGLALQHEALTGNHVTLRIEGDIPNVSMPVKIALYRVLQEALANAYRHAGVADHQVRLARNADWIELEVADDGRGFTPPLLDGPEATEREEHIGLRGMRERITLVGGQFHVYSRPGEGTRVTVKVPTYE
jgi:signal transduction histidine kinase